MADIETTHKISEQFEVQGAEEAASKFERLADMADKVAHSFGVTTNLSNKAKTGLAGVGDAGKKAGASAAEGAKEVGSLGSAASGQIAGAIVKANLATTAITKGFELAGQAVEFLKRKFIEVNDAQDDLADSLSGSIYALGTFGDATTPVERYGRAAQAARASLDDLYETAMATALPLNEIADAANRSEVLFMSAGKSQKDVLDFTREAAKAAKVYNIEIGGIADAARKLAVTGRSSKTDPFGIALGAEAGVKKTDALEVRLEKIQKALTRIGAPISEVNRGWGEASQKIETITNDLIRRGTEPAFRKLEDLANGVADTLEKWKPGIDKALSKAGDIFEVLWGVGERVVDIVVAVDRWTNTSAALGVIVGGVGDVFSFLEGVVGGITKGFDWLVEGVQALVDPGRGMTKLNALADGFRLKILQAVEAVVDLAFKLADLAVPDFIAKGVPGMGDLSKWADSTRADFKRNVALYDQIVAKSEAKAGIDPSSRSGREAAAKAQGVGLTKAERDRMLGGLLGTKRPLINVESITIKQDFSDSDPDRILVEFTDELENMGKRVLASAVGGRATELAPGG